MNHTKPIFNISILLLCIVAYAFAQDTTVTITSDGNVGIGLTNPAEKLHVVGSLQLDKVGPELGRLVLRTAAQGDPGRYGILFSNNLVAPFLGDDIGDQLYAFYSKWGNVRQYDAVLQIHGKADGSWGNVLRLTHNGTDGIIETDTGDMIFNPDGTVRVNIAGFAGGGTTTTSGFEIKGAPGYDAALGLDNGAQRWSIVNWSDNHLRFVKVTGTTFTPLTIQNNSFSNAIVIGENGVGIGKDNPAAMLDVNGAIYQRGNELHADYVFENDYQLESIDEHADFMWTNKHLSAIPRAQKDDEGREIVEVGAHRKGIVEELEKAHIYIDQLHNRINKLEAALEKVAAKMEADQ